MASTTIVIPPQPGGPSDVLILTSHVAGAKDTIMDALTPMTQDASAKPRHYAQVVG